MRLILAALLFALSLFADAIDDIVREEMEKQGAPGLALAVVRDGRPVTMRGYGTTEAGGGEPVTPDTLFQIGSVSKQFAATAVLLLAEQRKLALDDPLSTYLPEPCPAWSAVTIRQLLNHTSGIPNWIGVSTFSFEKEYAPAEYVRVFCALPVLGAPGERFAYSSAGYGLLALVVEKVSGRSFDEFVEKRVLRKAGLKKSYMYDGTCRGRCAQGYVREKAGLKPGLDRRPALTAPSGGVVSSVAQLAKYEARLLRKPILKPETAALMITPASLSGGGTVPYGLGWMLRDDNGKRRIYHTGTTYAGFRAAYARYPDDRLAVIVLMNVAGDGVVPDRIASRIAAAVSVR